MSVRDEATRPGRSPALLVSWFGIAVVVLVLAAGLLVAALTSVGEAGAPLDPAFEQVPTAEGAAPMRGHLDGAA